MGKINFLFSRKFGFLLIAVAVLLLILYVVPQTKPYIEGTIIQFFAVMGGTFGGFADSVMATPTFIAIAPYWPYIATALGFISGIFFMSVIYRAYMDMRRGMIKSAQRDSGLYQNAPISPAPQQVYAPQQQPVQEEKLKQ